MIERIVFLPAADDQADALADLIQNTISKIEAQPGCHKVKLLSDINSSACFTYSYWDSEADLLRYKQSAFFGQLWPVIKSHLAGKPMAWSVVEPKTDS